MRLFTQYGRALLLTVMLVAGAVCVSNGDNPSDLVGQWVRMTDGEKVELFKDGTGAVGNRSITWKTEGKRFVLTYSDGDRFIRDYNLSGYEFTQSNDDGKVFVWVKKDNVEEYKKKKYEEAKKEQEEAKKEQEKEQERIRKEAEQRLEKVSSYFTDSRNGQKYRAVKIGAKTWMAQNMNYQTGKSWCYGGDNSNCEKYGRLYDWNTAKTVCPNGWHLPSREEWGALAKAAGGTGDYGTQGQAGTMLKSTNGWRNGAGIDSIWFSALPSGRRSAADGGSFDGIGERGCWWTATEDDNLNAYSRAMSYYTNVLEYENVKGNGYSVRCLQD